MNELSQQVGDGNVDVHLPEELVAEARKTFKQKPDPLEEWTNKLDAKGSVPDAPDASSFAFHQHNYVTEYIKFADQKAALIFAAVTGMLCFLFKTGLQAMWLRQINMWSALDFLCFLSMLSLFFGLCAACFVLLPSLKKYHRGIVFFESVAEFELASTYASEVLTTPNQGLTRAILQHTFDLSKICAGKYKKLVFAIWGASVGTALSVLVLLFK